MNAQLEPIWSPFPSPAFPVFLVSSLVCHSVLIFDLMPLTLVLVGNADLAMLLPLCKAQFWFFLGGVSSCWSYFFCTPIYVPHLFCHEYFISCGEISSFSLSLTACDLVLLK